MLANTKIAALLVAALAASVSTPVGSQAACPAPGAPVAEPYRWYPALDLARIPFHTGAGPWGPRAPISAPAPPVTTRNVLVHSAAEFAAAARISGSLITVAAKSIGPVYLSSDVIDVDIVVPAGHRIAQLAIGHYSPPTTARRVRIRGTKPGEHSGGLLGGVFLASTPATDIIIDGVDLNGEDGKGGNLLWHFPRGAERVAIVNVRGHGAGPGSIMRATDVVIAGNRLMTGARSREVNGYPEGWGIRAAGGRIVVYDNRIDGTRYHRLRLHPEGQAADYAWIADNTFVDAHEARIVSVFNASGTSSHRYAAIWAVCNRIHAHSTCLPPGFDGMHADFALLTNNRFFGSFKQDLQRLFQTQHGPNHDYVTGNTFSPWQPPPAWQAPGDPATAVPLPMAVQSRHNPGAAAGTKPCPPP